MTLSFEKAKNGNKHLINPALLQTGPVLDKGICPSNGPTVEYRTTLVIRCHSCQPYQLVS